MLACQINNCFHSSLFPNFGFEQESCYYVSAEGTGNKAATWEYLWVHQGFGTQRVTATMHSLDPED